MPDFAFLLQLLDHFRRVLHLGLSRNYLNRRFFARFSSYLIGILFYCHGSLAFSDTLFEFVY